MSEEDQINFQKKSIVTNVMTNTKISIIKLEIMIILLESIQEMLI